MREVTVRHNFETSHRLPHLPGKCQSLHGHSWWAHVTVAAAQLGPDGTMVEFGVLKAGLRHWIDTRLDHGSMLGPDDPLVPLLRANGCKVHEVPGWPTVENVAAMIGAAAAQVLAGLDRAPGCAVARVRVTETHVNEATWQAT
jgi:6-pyruvoyltetrahydropterin/6-carboxytetrahydropterin synthase